MRTAVAVAAGLLLAANAEAQEPQRLADAYAKAVSCLPDGQKPKLRLDEVRFVVVPGNKIDVPRRQSEPLLVRAAFTPADSTVWIAEAYLETDWILVHELLHAIGIRGHPRAFSRCRLLEAQQK